LGNLLMLAGATGWRPVRHTPYAAPYAAEVESIAENLLAHRFPLLGLTIETGPTIDWRRDYVHGISTGTPR